MRVKLSGIQAWVCSRCGEIYFLPGGAERLAKAARSLFELALAGRQHRGNPTAHLLTGIRLRPVGFYPKPSPAFLPTLIPQP